MTASILIQTSKVLNLNIGSSKQENYLPVCDLKWRQKNLWIKNIADKGSYNFPALTRKQWLEKCLCNSWLKRVCIDPELGEKSIKLWADTCKRAGKPIFCVLLPTIAYLAVARLFTGEQKEFVIG